MFTGIVTDIGRVREVRETDRDRRYEIETAWNTDGIDLGASISHAGCCLTVTEKGPDWFAVEVSNETLSKTTLGGWKAGDGVNLERAARLGDEMGGHVVSGHVDGLGGVGGARAHGLLPDVAIAADDRDAGAGLAQGGGDGAADAASAAAHQGMLSRQRRCHAVHSLWSINIF